MARPKRQDRFSVKTLKGKNGKKRYRVEGYKSSGERIRKSFKINADAINYRAELETEIEDLENVPTLQKTRLTAEQISDAETAVKAAEGVSLATTVTHYQKLEAALHETHDISLDRAVAFALSHYKPETEELSIMVARERFLASRRNIAVKTQEHYKNTTRLLVLGDPNKLTHQFSVADIEKILSGYDNPNSHKTYRRGICTFFNWAKRFHHCQENPCDRLDKTPTDTSAISILSLDEAKRLLKVATLLHDGVCAASVAILLFAGLRPSELQDLKPEGVKDGHIRVTGGKLRRKLKRSVPIPPVLKEWLKVYPFKGAPDGWSYKQRMLRKSTKAKRWVSDIIRHTSISYQLERDRDEGRVAFNNGTSVQMINQHYRDVVDDQKMVKKLWSLTPDKLGEVEVNLGTSREKNKLIQWPTDPQLEKLAWEQPLTHLAQGLGCSDAAVRKRCRTRGIKLPKNGHWQRQRSRATLKA
ncbi:site-specific integrase [Coraliomargarita sp. W4R53]